ncbi:MAG: hypothetical protein AB7G12_06605 [Thermoanaerobaculia bacterium]
MRLSYLRFSPLLLALMASAAQAVEPPPERLSATGLYADITTKRVAEGLVGFTPQYPLWTDGATKRRWIYLPPGTFVDASDPDAWQFPVGTRVWKEFAFERRVETRMIELADSGWRFVSYRWLPDGSDAVLAAEFGERGVYTVAPGVRYDLPSRYDCRACHEGNVSRLLGFTALQLSSDRDPAAIHGGAPNEGDLDLAALVARGLVRNLSPALVAAPPRIPARTPLERTALGYLVGNCANCHNDRGALADLGFSLEVRVAPDSDPVPGAIRTGFGQPAHYQPAGEPAHLRFAAGEPEESAVWRRVSSRVAVTQMPPLGTKLVDREAVELLERWIRSASSVEGEVSKSSEKEMR